MPLYERRAIALGVTLAALGLTAPASAAPPPDGQALMHQADKAHKLPVEVSRVTMTLQPDKGERRVLSFEQQMQTSDKDGDRTKLRFLEPADVRGTTLLSVEPAPDAPADQWLYLPAFKKTRQVGSSELGDRFVGSDLFFEDLKGRPVDDFKYTVTGSEVVDGKDCHLIEGVPATPAVAKDSPYGKLQVWLRKDVLAPVRVRYFDRQGRPLKQLDTSKLVQVKGTAWRADQLTIVDVRRKHRTTITVDSRRIDAALPQDAFSRFALGAE